MSEQPRALADYQNEDEDEDEISPLDSQPTNVTDNLYSVSQPDISSQIIVEQKIKHKWWSFKAKVNTVAAVIILIILGSYIFHFSLKSVNFSTIISKIDSINNGTNSPQQTSTTTVNTELQKLALGKERTLVVNRGERYALADETIIQFDDITKDHLDLVFSDPDLISKFNQSKTIPISGQFAFYHKGYYFKVRALNFCNAKKTDLKQDPISHQNIMGLYYTDCAIKITSLQATAPTKTLKPFSRLFSEYEASSGVTVTNNAEEPVINVTFSQARMQIVSGELSLASGLESFRSDSIWPIKLVTAYGIGNINYSAKEIFSKQTKQTLIGNLRVKSEIVSFICTNYVLLNQDNCSAIFLKLSFSSEGSDSQPIIIDTYNNLRSSN